MRTWNGIVGGIALGVGASLSVAACGGGPLTHCTALETCCDASTFPSTKKTDCLAIATATGSNADAACAAALGSYQGLGYCGASGAGGAGTGSTGTTVTGTGATGTAGTNSTTGGGAYGPCFTVTDSGAGLQECYYYPTSPKPCAQLSQMDGHCPFGNCCVNGGTTSTHGTAICYSDDSLGLYKSNCDPPDMWDVAAP